MSTTNSNQVSDIDEHEQNVSNTGSILSFYPKEDNSDVEEIVKPMVFIKYENTYRMESSKPFNEHKASKIINNEIENFFNQNTKYVSNEMINICSNMSRNIRNSINTEMDFERYKIVCIVEIIEKQSQGILSIVRFLRDIKVDKFVKGSFENNNFLAAILVAAIYYE